MTYFTLQNQIDPGTSIDVYDGREWQSGWTLIRPAFRVKGHDGDHFSYGVHRSPRSYAVPVTFVRRTKEGGE